MRKATPVWIGLWLLAALSWAGESLCASGQDRRVALVIGNSDYENAPRLANPKNDAADVAAMLRRLGFEVIDGLNLSKRGMDAALARFSRSASDSDVALFYYAGHGIQFKGQNFLVPLDAKFEDEFSIPYETTRVDDILDALSRSRNSRLLILDACRNNPLVSRIKVAGRTRDMGAVNGLARAEKTLGSVIAYATQANEVAVDGAGRNSPFTAAFLEALDEPGLEVAQVFRRVAASVHRQTGGKQVPELSISLLGDLYLNQRQTDAQAWLKIRESQDRQVLSAFISEFPTSFLIDAAKSRIEALDQIKKEADLRSRMAALEADGKRAAENAIAQRQVSEAASLFERTERDRIAKALEDARREVSRQREDRERAANALTEAQLLLTRQQDESKRAVQALAAAQRDATTEKQERERTNLALERAKLDAAKQESERDRAAKALGEARDRLTSLEKLGEEKRALVAQIAQLEDNARRAETERQVGSDKQSRIQAEGSASQPARVVDELLALQQKRIELEAKKQSAGNGLGEVFVGEQRVASLPTPAASQGIDAGLSGPPLLALIRHELIRVGCLAPQSDERWSSSATSRAVREFSKRAGIEAPDLPSPTFLEGIRAKVQRVCSDACGVGQVERTGKCVPKGCPAGKRLDREGECVASPRRAEVTRKPAQERQRAPVQARSNGRKCFSFNGQSFCE